VVELHILDSESTDRIEFAEFIHYLGAEVNL
jgi:hypothetical protein